ncbi:MAG: flagellar biosynthesis protein FlhF [Phycisphaerales bacterium]|nr:flagellar biosynthesis protein FlhF [Phycisphaerales bacterium]
MKLRTFRANSMADALAAVKSQLGADAVILHTRTVKSGGILGLWRRSIVEVTASDEAPSPRRRTAEPANRPLSPDHARESGIDPTPTANPSARAAAVQAYARQAPTPTQPAASRPAAIDPPKNPSPPSQPAEKASVAATPRSAPPVAPSDVTLMRVRERARAAETIATGPVAAAMPSAASAVDIRRELSDIKLLVSQVLRSSPPPGVSACTIGATPDALFAEYLRLLESQVSRDIADRIVGAVRDELHPGELTDPAIVRETVLRHLSGMIQVAEPSRPAVSRSSPGRPFVVALVGPTGVGKTTTIAKLAATYKLRQGRSVGLITSDTYRIAAVDQLRTYADIIGLPLRVVQSPSEMSAAVHSLSSHDVVLIDSAGRSQHNTERLTELADLVAAAAPDETHLVLSSSSAPEVMFSAAEAFAIARPNRVILTKIDEAVHFGVIVNIMQRLSTSLSFVTTGQEVPDHIEPGSAERLARLILDRRADRARPVSTPDREMSAK